MLSNTHNGWNGEFLLLSIVKELEDIISNDNTALSAEDVYGTHDCNLLCSMKKFWISEGEMVVSFIVEKVFEVKKFC
jgi:hypothetical protein